MGRLNLQVSSQALKTIYIMSKIDKSLDWSDGGESQLEFSVEYMVYNPMTGYNDSHGYSNNQYAGYSSMNNNSSNEGISLFI